MTKITLRAKSDGTEISGVLIDEDSGHWRVVLAPKSGVNSFTKRYWDRVYELPTKPGCVFRATVRGVENVRVMVTKEDMYDSETYVSYRLIGSWYWHAPEDIDPATVVIELEGVSDE